MALAATDYRSIIFQLANSEKREFAVNEFYEYLARKAVLSADDLASTTLKGHKTNEPRWKRNLRNTLQQLKSDGELVNSKKDYWRIPSPDPNIQLDYTSSWNLIKAVANDVLQRNIPWNSTQIGKEYRIKEITNDRITIYREESHDEESISVDELYRAITCLNAAGGSVGRRTLNNVVAKETTIVFLHPLLDWFDGGNQIGIIALESGRNVDEHLTEEIVLNEIENDRIDVYDIIKRKRRKAQDRFKANLMKAYGGKCCVSDITIENVLSGAHIEPHALAGDNSSTNGLLLRADIHKLFDDGLIAINPRSLEIAVHPSLRGSIYWDFNGNNLLERLDGKKPNDKILTERWKSLKWTRSLL
jgi:Predicted restriction endonuclease